MIRITGSKVHRFWRCPASAVLPQAWEGDEESPAQRRGKQIHRYLELARQIGTDAAMDQSDEELLPLLKAIDLDQMPDLDTEVAYRVNVREGQVRMLGSGLDRQYDEAAGGPPGDYEIDLTIDLAGADTAKSVAYAGDYKSGHSKYPAPDLFGQTLLGAVAVTRTTMCDSAVTELLHIHSDGDHHKVTREVDEWTMSAFLSELVDAFDEAKRIEDRMSEGKLEHWQIPVREGKHCEYCQAFSRCPAKMSLAGNLRPEIEALGVVVPQEDGSIATIDRDPRVITVSRASKQWMAIERLEAVLSRIKEDICGMAAYEEIPLPDGRVIGRVQRSKRKLDGRIAAEYIEKRYGRAARSEVAIEEVSLDRFKRAISSRLEKGQKAQTRKGDGEVDKALREVDKLGGLGVESSDSIKPHIPRKKLPVAR